MKPRALRCVAPKYPGVTRIFAYPFYEDDAGFVRARVPHPGGGSAVYDLRVIRTPNPRGLLAETAEMDEEGRKVWRLVG